MPGVPSVWATSPASNAPISAGRLNYDLYTYDSNQFHPTGINFHTFRPLFYEVLVNYGVGTEAGYVSGTYTDTGLNDGGNSATSTPTSISVYDTSGMWGTGGEYTQGAYQYGVNVPGSDGAGNPGGYYLMGHFAETSGETSTSLYQGADMVLNTGGEPVVSTGGRQAMNSAKNNAAFYLDLVPTGPNAPAPMGTNVGVAFVPAVGIQDTAATSLTKYTVTASSASNGDGTLGNCSRHWNAWAAVNNGTGWGSQNNVGIPQLLWPMGTQLTSTLMSNAVETPLQFLGNPPCFRAATTAGQSIPNNTKTVVQFPTGASTVVYNGFTYWVAGATSTYTIQVAGLYLFHGVVSWASSAQTAFSWAGALINGVDYWGPAYYGGGLATAGTICATKTQIFSLEVGDTVQLLCQQNNGAALGLSTSVQSRMLLQWLGGNGKTLPGGTIGQPNTTLTVPDPSFRFQAGTPGPVAQNQFQQHLGNDINWFFNVPYFMGYQSAVSSLLTAGDWSGPIPLQTRTGAVHGDAGDPWGGWNATSDWWVPPATGWYLVCSEQTVAGTNLAATSSLAAGIAVTSSGGKTPASVGISANFEDWYQVIYTGATGTPPYPAGATAIGLYYLEAGDNVYITAMAQAQTGAASTFVNTTSPTWATTHMEIVWMGA